MCARAICYDTSCLLKNNSIPARCPPARLAGVDTHMHAHVYTPHTTSCIWSEVLACLILDTPPPTLLSPHPNCMQQRNRWVWGLHAVLGLWVEEQGDLRCCWESCGSALDVTTAGCRFQHLFEAPTQEWSGLRWGGRAEALEFDGHATLILERCFIHPALFLYSLRCSGNQSGGSFNRYLSLTISSSGSFLMHARSARPRSGTIRIQLHSVRIEIELLAQRRSGYSKSAQ